MCSLSFEREGRKGVCVEALLAEAEEHGALTGDLELGDVGAAKVADSLGEGPLLLRVGVGMLVGEDKEGAIG